MFLIASEMWRTKNLLEESWTNGSADSVYQITVKIVIICKILFPVCDFQEGIFFIKSSQWRILLWPTKIQTESLLVLVGIFSCAHRGWEGMCLHPVIALGKEADALHYFRG